MPRINITKITTSRDGVNVPTGDNGDTVNQHQVVNTGRTRVFVRNADAVNPHNVTFVTPGTVDGQVVADRLEAVVASGSQVFGPFPTGDYGGLLKIDVDSAELKLWALEP